MSQILMCISSISEREVIRPSKELGGSSLGRPGPGHQANSWAGRQSCPAVGTARSASAFEDAVGFIWEQSSILVIEIGNVLALLVKLTAAFSGSRPPERHRCGVATGQFLTSSGFTNRT